MASGGEKRYRRVIVRVGVGVGERECEGDMKNTGELWDASEDESGEDDWNPVDREIVVVRPLWDTRTLL